jgi:two-component system phosphate regulon sensor histidine kinase PhoR
LYPFPETIRAFNEALRSGKSYLEVEEKEKFFRVEISKIEENLLLVQKKDISCEKKLEKIKKDIVSTLSHELRTPITVIKGNAEYLLHYSNAPDKEIVEEILEKTSRILEILSGLNKLISIEKNFREHNLKELILNSLKDLIEKAQKRGLKVEIELEEVVVPCEKILVEQLLRNIVDNAIKFTKKGKIKISLYKSEKEVIISVEDNGKGIKEELKKHIFEKYVKSPESDGQGIGLSVVKEIVNFHNWKIDFQSEEGKGTTFFITIPLS